MAVGEAEAERHFPGACLSALRHELATSSLLSRCSQRYCADYIATSTPWAILLCKFQDISAEPQPKSFFETLFCAQGVGMGGLVDYWQQVSNGRLDLAGSLVFGWFQLDHTSDEDKELGRYERIMRGIDAAQGAMPFDR